MKKIVQKNQKDKNCVSSSYAFLMFFTHYNKMWRQTLSSVMALKLWYIEK